MNSFLTFLYVIAVMLAAMLISFMTFSSFSQYRNGNHSKLIQGVIWLAVLAAVLVFTVLRGGIIASAIGTLIGAMPFLKIANKETDDQVAANRRDAEKRQKEFEKKKAEREAKRKQK